MEKLYAKDVVDLVESYIDEYRVNESDVNIIYGNMPRPISFSRLEEIVENAERSRREIGEEYYDEQGYGEAYSVKGNRINITTR